MATLVYRPGHPEANRNGMVEKAISGRVPGSYIISDTIDGTWHPADGKLYDSKSGFRRTTKARGMVEIGTERQADKRNFETGDLRRDIESAVRKVNEGYRPSTEPGSYSGDGWQ